MIRTKKFENLPQITSISPSGKIVVTENGVDKVISFEDFSNLPPATEVWDNASTTFTASEVNVTDIQSAADSKLLDLKVNTTSKFVVRKDGNLGIGVTNPAAKLDISDTVLAGSGSLAGSALNLAQTWNTTGNPTAIKLNVTNTASGAASNLLDLQVGGSSKFRVAKDGQTFGGISSDSDNGYYRTVKAIKHFQGYFAGVTNGALGGCGAAWVISGTGDLAWSDSSQATSCVDLRLSRDGASILAQRNGVNPQTFRLYNTYTDATTFERLNIKWDTNVLKLGTEKGGSGGTARAMELQTDGTTRMSISGTGIVSIDSIPISRGIGTNTDSIAIGGGLISNTTGRYNSALGFYALLGNTTGASNTAFGFDALSFNTTGNSNSAFGHGTLRQTTSSGNVGFGFQALFYNTTGSPNSAIGYQALYSNTTGSNNSSFGYRSLYSNTTGNFNLAIGNNALLSNSTGSYNLAIGEGALNLNTTGIYNVSVGYQSLYRNTTGSNNSAFGISALYNNTTGDSNSAFGFYALVSNTTGGSNSAFGSGALQANSTGGGNSAFGSSALTTNTTGVGNSGFGISALQLNENGEFNSAFGHSALRGNTTGSNNSAFGSYTLFANTTGYANVAVGRQALYINTTGYNNSAVGHSALYSNTIGDNNSGFGYYALFSNTIGNRNSAFGNYALYLNTTGNYNLAIGYRSLYSNTTATSNSAVGYEALYSNTTGNNNSAFGYNALLYNTTGSSNTALGVSALYSNTTGLQNVAVGVNSMLSNTTGNFNTAVGHNALSQNTTGVSNSAVGYLALQLNTTGAQNSAFGDFALRSNTTGVQNSAFGKESLTANATGLQNSAFGYISLYSNTSGSYNSAFGVTALYSNTTGSNNSVLGFYALFSNTTGVNNVGIGSNAGRYITGGSIANSISNYSVFLGSDTKAAASGQTNQIVIGDSAQGIGSHSVVLGNDSILTTALKGNVGIGTTAPSSILDISDNTGFQKNVTLSLRNGSFGWWTITSSNSNSSGFLRFSSNNSGQTPLTLDGSTGSVGISNGFPAAKLDVSDTTLAGSGSLAGSVLNLAQTWNTTGAPTAIKLNVTNTASGAASNLLDLQVGGVSKCSIDKNGAINSAASASLGSITISNGIFLSVAGGSIRASNGTAINLGSADSTSTDNFANLFLRSSAVVSFNGDAKLLRDDANTLALRNGVNPQTFRLYNTFTDSSNYERAFIKWDSGILKIGTEASGTGALRSVEIFSTGVKAISLENYQVNIHRRMSASLDTGGNSDISGTILYINNLSSNTNSSGLFVKAGNAGGTGYIAKFESKLGNQSLFLESSGNIGVGTTTPTEKLDVIGNLKVSGHFSATTKSFLIPHPTKPDKKLQYACLEGPENGVYIRGKTNEPIILLPDYWSELVDADSITVTVTPIGKPQQLFVVSQNSTSVEIGNVDGLYNYLIFAERKDVNKLQTEI